MAIGYFRFGSAVAAGLKRPDDSFQTHRDIGGGISALRGLAGRSSLQGAIELSPAADGSRPNAAIGVGGKLSLNARGERLRRANASQRSAPPRSWATPATMACNNGAAVTLPLAAADGEGREASPPLLTRA